MTTTLSPRELGVDLARGAAIVSMFIAHTAPSGGPAGVFNLSEFLTFPLFALLVGVGAELGKRRLTAGQHAGATVVRAVALLALGWWLAEFGALVIIVLAPLGVLTLVTWVLCRLPSTVLGGVALLTAVVAPWTVSASEGARFDALVSQSTARAWMLDLFVSDSYPQAVLVVAASAGILLVRLLLPEGPRRVPLLLHAGVAAGLLVLSGALFAADLLGWVDIVAYETTWFEQLFVVALAGAVLAGGVTVARLPGARLLEVLAWMGAMTLTLYVLHVFWLAYWIREIDPTGDDTWVNVLLLIAGSAVVATAWRLLRLPPPWTRGPVEGVVGAGVTQVVTRMTPSDERARFPSEDARR